MHPNQIYAVLKALLADLTKRPKNKISANTVLGAPPPGGLGFTGQGLSALAQEINRAFSKAGHPITPPLTPAETRSAKTVKDLFSLISRRFGGNPR